MDDFPEFAAGERIDADGRLIQKQQFGGTDERAGETKLLFHSPGNCPASRFL